MSKDCYTIKEYASLTGKAQRTIRQWLKDDKVAHKLIKGKTGLEYGIVNLV